MGEGDQRAALQWQGAELSGARGLKYEITILLSIFNIFSIFFISGSDVRMGRFL